MKTKHIILSIILLMATTASAQTPKTGKAASWLNASAGFNIADCYDNGTIPFAYLGKGANLGLGATFEWRRCHIQLDERLFFNSLSELSSFAITTDTRLEFLYRVHDSQNNRFHIWVGGDFQGYMDIKEIYELMNASMGITLFGNFCLASMVQFDFASIRGGTHPLLTLHGKLVIPVAGFAIRPGFAYMDNYTNDLNIANTLLSDYELFPKALPGICTDMGLTFNLLNGNRIGLSYRWDYLSTGRKGTYRYDNALHSLNLNFMFKLN